MNARPDLFRRRQAVQAEILAAAIAEFAERGLDGATTQGIADRAGITKTRLHYHIAGKEELYLQALDHVVAVWDEQFHGLDPAAGPESVLAAYVRRKLDHALDHPDVARLYTLEIMRGAPHLRAIWEPSRAAARRAAGVISGWVAAGLIRPVDPMQLMFSIWAMTQHHALHRAEVAFMLGLPAGAAPDRDAIAAEIADLVLRGLRP